MARNKTADQQKATTVLHRSSADSTTTWRPEQATTTPPRTYTEALFQRDLEIVSRRISKEISDDADEAALLRRRRQEGRAGKSKPRPPKSGT